MAPQTRTVALMRERRKVPTNPMVLIVNSTTFPSFVKDKNPQVDVNRALHKRWDYSFRLICSKLVTQRFECHCIALG